MDLYKLLSGATGGDGSAENELFRYLLVRFTAIAKRRIGERDAEDIAHEACLTILEKYKTENFAKGFEPWAYRILKNKIGNYYQRKRDTIESQSETTQMITTSFPRSDHELKGKLLACLRQLISRNLLYARVLNFTYQGYTTDEICHRLHIKPNHFYVSLNRGRKMMRTCLETGRI